MVVIHGELWGGGGVRVCGDNPRLGSNYPHGGGGIIFQGVVPGSFMQGRRQGVCLWGRGRQNCKNVSLPAAMRAITFFASPKKVAQQDGKGGGDYGEPTHSPPPPPLQLKKKNPHTCNAVQTSCL